jgi:ribosomal protein S18 acetylase RimI-like enzyme
MGYMAVGLDKVGLETWGSNTAAVRTYVKAGAQLVTTKDDLCPTLVDDPKIPKTADGQRSDVRQFMRFPQTFAA